MKEGYTMVNFSEPINFDEPYLKTTYKGNDLFLYDFEIYDGPITMQALPYGGIQSVYHGKIIIHTKSGFIEVNRVRYCGSYMDSETFIDLSGELVNDVLPS